MSKKPPYYLTTAIHYVNGAPHLGHAYETVAADALARFTRLSGNDTHFLTGLDEHGQKVAKSAAAKGLTPQEWVDGMAPLFLDAWQALGISNDDFIRTTEPRHTRAVQQFFAALQERGYLYAGTYQGFYCEPDETFYTQEQLAEFAQKAAAEGHPSETSAGEKLCPYCQRPLSFVEEENLYFKLSEFTQPLLDYYEAHPDFIQPESRKNEVLSFVRGGLEDLSVSRTSFDWGVPIPFAPGHVSYVWVDALINYITAVGYGAGAANEANDATGTSDANAANGINAASAAASEALFARYWPAQIHFIGKDIIRFHCVIWPALLMAVGLPAPQKVFAHGFLLIKGEKMSKSRGNVMAPLELAQIFSPDGFRYYFLADISFGADASISLERMLQVYNADLANSWGNLCSRTLNMTAKYLNGITPKLSEALVKQLTKEMGNPLASLVSGAGVHNAGEHNAGVHNADAHNAEAQQSLYARYASAFSAVDYAGALAVVRQLVDAANLYIEQSAPWALAKAAAAETETAGASPAPTQAQRLAFVLYNVLEAMRICALLFAPVMPTSSEEVWRRLGLGSISEITDQAVAATWGGLPAGCSTEVGEPLFMRITEAELDL